MLACPVRAAAAATRGPTARSEEEGLEELRRLLDDRRAPDELLHGEARHRHHRQAAVLDLGDGHVRALVLQVERVEAQVARHVAARREALDIVQGVEPGGHERRGTAKGR